MLYEGRQVFFGPVNSAADYFIDLGFTRPDRANTPDFLTSITNPGERVVREGFENRVPRTSEEFATRWDRSREARSLQADIESFNLAHPIRSIKTFEEGGISAEEMYIYLLPTRSPLAYVPLRISTFPLDFHQQVLVCLHRAYQRLWNNYIPVLSTVLANSVLGIIIGSAFYNLGETTNDLRQRSILLFFAAMLNSFVPAFEIDVMWAQRPIVEKQGRYAFYHPFVERVASTLCDLPAKLALSLLLHLPIYFMTNLQRTPASFFTYWCFMLVNLLTMAMLFRMIGSLSRSRDGTMTPVSILTLLCVLYAGFVVPPPYMVPWLGWFRYINPVAYTYESLMINEFHNRKFTCLATVPGGPRYDGLNQRWKSCPDVGRIPGTNQVDGPSHIDLKYGYPESNLWRNLGILLSMMVAFSAVHLLAVEYIPAEKSRGEVLRFSRKPILSTRDIENAQPEHSAHIPPASCPPDSATATGKTPNTDATHLTRLTSSFQWSDIAYEVNIGKGSRKILKGVDGWLKPGSFTVLMGVTGAGKTTLLDILADRVSSGKITGDVLVDGKPRDATDDFHRKMGYVQQNDIHLPTATVREALQFSAMLRQSRTTLKREKLAYVDTILGLLEMEAYADAVVGVPGEGLNVEQRKRLSIAVEMVAMPEHVLFLGNTPPKFAFMSSY